MQCSGMQVLYAQLTGEDLCSIALCYAHIFGVVVFNASMLNRPGGVHLPSIYMHCPGSSSGCSGTAYIYICRLAVCKASMLN